MSQEKDGQSTDEFPPVFSTTGHGFLIVGRPDCANCEGCSLFPGIDEDMKEEVVYTAIVEQPGRLLLVAFEKRWAERSDPHPQYIAFTENKISPDKTEKDVAQAIAECGGVVEVPRTLRPNLPLSGALIELQQ